MLFISTPVWVLSPLNLTQSWEQTNWQMKQRKLWGAEKYFGFIFPEVASFLLSLFISHSVSANMEMFTSDHRRSHVFSPTCKAEGLATNLIPVVTQRGLHQLKAHWCWYKLTTACIDNDNENITDGTQFTCNAADHNISQPSFLFPQRVLKLVTLTVSMETT